MIAETRIGFAKSQLKLHFGNKVKNMRYEKLFDCISGMGKDLNHSVHAIGKINKDGYGRYRLTSDLSSKWFK
jgi:hypothetical protein